MIGLDIMKVKEIMILNKKKVIRLLSIEIIINLRNLHLVFSVINSLETLLNT